LAMRVSSDAITLSRTQYRSRSAHTLHKFSL
jgi:hypothetical protein